MKLYTDKQMSLMLGELIGLEKLLELDSEKMNNLLGEAVQQRISRLRSVLLDGDTITLALGLNQR